MKIHANEGSFKDPMGRVYHVSGEHGDKIIRGLTRDGSATLKKLLTERFFQSLMSKGEVIGTHLLPVENSYARQIVGAGWHSAIEHDPVSFVSWPYEWPFSMLKDAALLQLSLLEESIAHGWTLKDATPFNVQWRGARPTFVDVTSFVPWDGRYWRAYRQFCATYLAPLLLTAHLGIPFQPLLRSRLEGLAADEAARYFRGLSRFRRGVPSHILFPAVAERMSVRGAAPAKSRQRQSETMQRALFDSLRRLISSLSCRSEPSEWVRYRDSHSYGADESRKKRFVGEHAAAEHPALVWDLGANTGAMSRVAAQSADTVVAVDSDHGVVETLYKSLLGVGEPQNIIPLVMDVANPSPAQGWAGRERAAFGGRRSPDLVLCLALIHHLRVVANIPVALLLDWLRSLQAVVIVEFVDRDDEMFQKLLANKDELYPDYTAENFNCEVARRFHVRQRLRLKGGLRELLVLGPR